MIRIAALLLISLLPARKVVDALSHAPSYCVSFSALAKDTIPALLKGNFTDDYNIRYSISDSLWIQYPQAKYHIIKWNAGDQYIIARNDHANPGDVDMYTRIDYMPFTGMAPFLWGFCLTVYDAKSDSLAELTPSADREHPRKGCNGYPFSRMKRAD